MPRPKCRSLISHRPRALVFKPGGCLPSGVVVLGLDEVESLRLADLEGLYHEEGSARMGVSRATFGRILDSARRKSATAVVLGRTLIIEGGGSADGVDACDCPSCSRAVSPTPDECRRGRGDSAGRTCCGRDRKELADEGGISG